MKLLILLLLTTSAMASKYEMVQVVHNRASTADVLEVKKLSAVLKKELTPGGHFENATLVLTVGLKVIASACENIVNVETLPSQRSLDSVLNPSDFYFRVTTKWKDGCATGSFGDPKFIKFERKFHIGQRPGSEAGKPWPKTTGFAVRHFSFDIGMMGGFNRWGLFELDYSDLDDVKFSHVKNYTYVQGEVKNY